MFHGGVIPIEAPSARSRSSQAAYPTLTFEKQKLFERGVEGSWVLLFSAVILSERRAAGAPATRAFTRSGVELRRESKDLYFIGSSSI